MEMILITALVLLLLMVVGMAIHQRRLSGRGPNYRALFILGVVWLPLGLGTQNLALWGPGLAFFIVGLANRKRWEPVRWSDLSDGEKRLKIRLISVLVLALLVGLGIYFLSA